MRLCSGLILAGATKAARNHEFFRAVLTAGTGFDIGHRLETLLEKLLQFALGTACQNLGHKGAALVQNIKGEIGRCLTERDDAQMVGLLMPRGRGRHIAHHDISLAAQPAFDGFISVIFHEIQLVDFSARNRLDLLEVHTDDAANGFGLLFAKRIDAMTGKNGGKAEVEASLNALFTYAAWADKWDGAARGVPIKGIALAMKEPVGVIAALCRDDMPLLGLVRPMGASMAMGNRCILTASEPFPLAATDFIQVLETSDVPAGVVNILTGSHTELALHMAAHNDVDAVWSQSSSSVSAVIEANSIGNLKRTWANNGQSVEITTRDYLSAATETKTVWVPYGE